MTPGYHLTKIERGILGQTSKIREELEELLDAERQGCKVMMLVELSDMVGAIEMFLDNRFPGVSLSDLHTMAGITRRAFSNGHRTPRED